MRSEKLPEIGNTVVCKLTAAQWKQDKGRADAGDGSTDTAPTSKEQGLSVYISRAIKKENNKGTWTEVVMELHKVEEVKRKESKVVGEKTK